MRIRDMAVAALFVCVLGASNATAADPFGILQTAFNHYDRGETTLAIAAASRALRTTDDPQLQNLAYQLRAVIYREQGDTISAETNQSLARRAAQQAPQYADENPYDSSYEYDAAYPSTGYSYYDSESYDSHDGYEYYGDTLAPSTITIDLGQSYHSIYTIRRTATLRVYFELP